MLIWLLLGCLLTRTPANLREVYLRACVAWFPYHARVVAVEYCEEAYTCSEIGVGQGGGYGFNNHTITIDRSYRFESDGLFLTLAHEYGHALGLEHSGSHESIMHEGWTPPLASGPGEADFQALRNMK